MKNIILAIITLLLAGSGFSQAPAPLDSLEKVVQETTVDSSRLNVLKQIMPLVFRRDIQKQMAYAGQMVDLARKLQKVNVEITGLYYLGVGYVFLSDYEKAKSVSLKGLQLSESIKDERKTAMLQSILGSIYRETNQLDSALFYLFQSAETSKRIGDKNQLAFNYNGIASLYVYQHDTIKGKAYFLKTKDIYQETGNLEGLGQAYNNLSTIAIDNDTSIYYLEQAKTLFEKANSAYGLSLVYPNLGKEYTEKGEYDKALEYLLKARQLMESSSQQFRPNLLGIYRNMGLVKAAKGEIQEAIDWYNQAVELSKELDEHFYLSNTYGQLSDLYERSGNAAEALKYYKMSMAEKDLWVDENKAKQTIESETRFQTAEKERAIVEQQLEIERQAREKNRILFGGIILLLLLLGLFQYFRLRQRIKRKETELALELEHAETAKLRELDQLKSRFFANISHEFRTPLTLIKGPLQDLRAGRLQGDRQKYFKIMERNTDRLLKLVNQILDLSKLDSGKMVVHPEKGELFKFIKAIASSFESLAQRKQIDFILEVPDFACFTNFDKDKLEKILANLLSNAFKFTQEEGRVSLSARIMEEVQGREQLEIVVKDTGIGIPADQLSRIFDRFYQYPEQHDVQQSTGIGLTLTKELTELLGGEITVESQADHGSTFTVTIPLDEVEKTAAREPAPELSDTQASLGNEPAASILPAPANTQQAIVLVVEDNDDVRNYIKDQLIADYRLVEAENGKQGLEKALNVIPDLIISDVVMPEMDGIEMCNQLKKNELTSHVPVILLTAKAEREDKLTGLEAGVEDYLIKPFDTQELQIKVRNLIRQRQKLQERFQSNFSFKPGEVAVTSVDEEFLQKVKLCIEKNLDDETFSVVELGRAIGMSRSQLHRKLKALTNQSPNKIIREMRLIRAKELLEKKAGNASEVAFMVGFNSLAYFTKCFGDYFGKSPSEVLKEKT